MTMGGDVVVRSGETATDLGLGQTLLLPAAVGLCTVEPRGRATLLTCVVP